MNYPIEKLDDCIFDYLVYNKEQIFSIVDIYNSISNTKNTHRCSELLELLNKEKNKKKFMETCYLLDTIYINIHKFCQGNKLYLIYSDSDSEQLSNKLILIDDIDMNKKDNEFDLCDVVETVIDNITDVTTHTNILKHDTIKLLIINKKDIILKKILNVFDLDLDKKENGENLMDVAVKYGNKEIVIEFMQHKYNILNADNMSLKHINSNIIKSNTLLLEKNEESIEENKKLEIMLVRSRRNFVILNCFYFTLASFFAYYTMFKI
jgi:predicted kinase